MPRYRLAIFDFDGTLADSLPWFRTVFQDLIAKFDLAPVSAEELEGLRGRSGREIIARLNMPMWKLPAISRDMRRRKLAAANQISLFDGVPQLLADLRSLGIHTAIVSSDSEASVRRVLGPSAALIARFDCGASLFGKHHKFKRVALRGSSSESFRGPLHWRRTPRYRSRQSRRHGLRRGRLGLRPARRAAGSRADAFLPDVSTRSNKSSRSPD